MLLEALAGGSRSWSSNDHAGKFWSPQEPRGQKKTRWGPSTRKPCSLGYVSPKLERIMYLSYLSWEKSQDGPWFVRECSDKVIPRLLVPKNLWSNFLWEMKMSSRKLKMVCVPRWQYKQRFPSVTVFLDIAPEGQYSARALSRLSGSKAKKHTS